MNKVQIITLCFAVFITANGCYNISNLQSASLLPKKEVELTGAYSLSSFHDIKLDENDIVTNSINVSGIYGFNKYVNGRIRYDILLPTYELIDVIHYISIGVKAPLYKKYLAFYLPVSFYLSQEINDYKNTCLEPAVIATAYFKRYVNLNFSLSYQIFFEDIENVLRFTAGVDLKDLVPSFMIRPEFGVAAYAGLDGFYYSTGIGFSYNIKSFKE